MHSRHLHPLICGIFLPNSVNVARYASFIWQKSPTNCRIHLSESNFQTRSNLSGQRCHFISASNEPSSRARADIWRMPRGSDTPPQGAGYLTNPSRRQMQGRLPDSFQ
ncbi:DUF6783 domain-containing protein [Lachnospiraceae bacterium JLR.KK009]